MLQRPLSGEGGKVASGRDGARLALTRKSEAEASSRQTQALGPGLSPGTKQGPAGGQSRPGVEPSLEIALAVFGLCGWEG